jgi:hypothetical protein
VQADGVDPEVMIDIGGGVLKIGANMIVMRRRDIESARVKVNPNMLDLSERIHQ